MVLRPNRELGGFDALEGFALYSSRRSQDIFPFLGGRSSYFGQTRILSNTNRKRSNIEEFATFLVFDPSKFLLGKTACLAKKRTGATEERENVLEPPR